MLRVRSRDDFSKRWLGHDDCRDYAPLIAWFQAGEKGTSTLVFPSFVSKICERNNVSSLFPSLVPVLIQQPAGLCFLLVDPFPFGDRNILCSVAASESHKSILKHPCWMPEQALIFCAFCANIKAHFGLMKCPIHD